MSDTADLLATLADVQEPLAPEQAIPWLLLVNLLLLFALPVIAWIRIHRHRNRWRRESLRTLANIPADADSLPALATLLRRIARFHLGEGAGHLDGEVWLSALDRCFDTHWFTAGDGRVFGTMLYQPDVAANTRVLHTKIKLLIKRLPARRSQELTDVSVLYKTA